MVSNLSFTPLFVSFLSLMTHMPRGVHYGLRVCVPQPQRGGGVWSAGLLPGEGTAEAGSVDQVQALPWEVTSAVQATLTDNVYLDLLKNLPFAFHVFTFFWLQFLPF